MVGSGWSDLRPVLNIGIIPVFALETENQVDIFI